MPGYPLTLQDAPQSEDVQFLEEQINAYNIARTGRDDGKELAFFLRDENEQLSGGLYGWTWAGWLEVRFLWLREELRGQGRGRSLLQAAEAEALRRGCSRALLDSYSFQAPDFYKRLGYQEFGVLEGFPGEHSRAP